MKRRVVCITVLVLAYACSIVSTVPSGNIMHILDHTIREAQEKRPYVVVAHDVGMYLAKQYNSNMTQALAACGSPTILFGGCLHGVVMEYYKTKGPDYIAGVCKDVSAKAIGIAKNCAHGLGHGLFTAKNLPQNNECSLYVEGQLYQDCVSGGFMETMLHSHHSKHMHVQHEVRIPNCALYTGPEKQLCAGAIGSYSLYYAESSSTRTFSECIALELKEHTRYCITAARARLRLAPKAAQQAFCDILAPTEYSCK